MDKLSAMALRFGLDMSARDRRRHAVRDDPPPPWPRRYLGVKCSAGGPRRLLRSVWGAAISRLTA